MTPQDPLPAPPTERGPRNVWCFGQVAEHYALAKGAFPSWPGLLGRPLFVEKPNASGFKLPPQAQLLPWPTGGALATGAAFLPGACCSPDRDTLVLLLPQK